VAVPYFDTRQHPPFVSISGSGIVAKGMVEHGRAAFTTVSMATFTAWRAAVGHLCKCNQALIWVLVLMTTYLED
jgi:hypothetical protein